MAAIIVRADGSTLSFDAVTRITYSPSVTVTDHPVEDGSQVSDHAQRQPLLIALTAIVSESPFARVADTGGTEHTLAALAFLDAIAEERVSVVDERLGTFADLQITRWPHTVDKLLRLEIPIEFKQVRIATAGYVSIPPSQPVASAQTGFPDKQDQGKGATASTNTGSTAGGGIEGAAQEEKDKSILLELLESTGVL